MAPKDSQSTSEPAQAESSPAKPELEPDSVTMASAEPHSSKAEAASVKKSPVSAAAAASSKKSAGLPDSKTYVDLIHDAIVAINDRTGSSLPALHKYILTHYPALDGPHFKARINVALKAGCKSERLQKVRCSYKVSAKYKEKQRQKARRKKETATTTAAVKSMHDAHTVIGIKPLPHNASTALVLQHTKKVNALKWQELQKDGALSEEELQKAKHSMRKREHALRRKLAAEKEAQRRAERLRRRRFPMEDTALHAEDKELNVRPPQDVKTRPYLPYFWYVTTPLALHEARQGKTPTSVLQYSKADGLDFGNRGLVSDLLQVYHFFRGDVRFQLDPGHDLVAPFSLSQLVHATEQILNGQAKRNRLVPPLLSHLFCTCLQILCHKPNSAATATTLATPVAGSSATTSMGTTTATAAADAAHAAILRQMDRDLDQFLRPALNAVSWPDVCYLYMDACDRYACSDASYQPVVPPLNVDVPYLLGLQDQPLVPLTPAPYKAEKELQQFALPDGYQGYLGGDGTENSANVLYKAHQKLGKHDAWHLTAEELMALLRALCDDVLASHPALAAELETRESQMRELLRAKRSADMTWRKVRNEFEGTTNAKAGGKRSAATTNGDNEPAGLINGEQSTPPKNGENGSDHQPADETDGKKADDGKLAKPSVTKKKLEAAKKAQQKASEAYEGGIRKLVARTEPIGYDRNWNAVYCFRHDPDVLYVEDLRPPAASVAYLPDRLHFSRRSWHVIEVTSLFDAFVASLDIRGRREHDLYEELMGPSGSNQSVRHFLHNDLRRFDDARSKEREVQRLQERVAAARAKCDEEQGRRSGRLASTAEVELAEAEKALEDCKTSIQQLNDGPGLDKDYAEITGYTLLSHFDHDNQITSRRTREKKASLQARSLPIIACSKTIATGNLDGTGLVGILVARLLEVEERCEALTPWERQDVTRSTWISKLENVVHVWNSIGAQGFGSPVGLGSSIETSGFDTPSSRRGSVGSPENKRRRVDTPASQGGTSSLTIGDVLKQLRNPLVELEHRVAAITNVDVATHDAKIADDNMSTDGDDEDEEMDKQALELEWKRIVYKLSVIPATRQMQVRELLVKAIAAARKAHMAHIVSELREALLLHHPSAAGDAKNTALQLLNDNGGYEPDEDDDEPEQDDADEGEDNTDDVVVSVFSVEAALLASCLGGTEDATRTDWMGAVRDCKTLGRFASLASAFADAALARLQPLEDEHALLLEALEAWEKEDDRKSKGRPGKTAGRPPRPAPTLSEVWANVRFIDEICMVKAEQWPWWPAKKCQAKDPALAERLSKLDRELVALVGEMGGIRVVKSDQIRPFTGNKIEQEPVLDGEGNVVSSELSKEVRGQLNDCMAMARRILRGSQNSELWY